MEALLSLLNETVLFQFLLLFARVVSFMAFMPVFGHAAVSPRIRVSLALFFTFFIYPLVDIQSNINQDNFILALFSEITLGLVASMFVNIIFSAVRVIGEFVEYSTALSMASMFDPTTGSQEGLVAKMLFWIAIVLFFQTGMYEMTLVILVKSFSVIHLGTFDIFSYNGIQLAIDEVKRMFTFAFAFALPLFFIGFIMDVYYGYGTKSMPAFSPFIITFQLKFALIFIFLILGMEIFADAFTQYFIDKFQ
ncbi:flagellar biosynthetic protein FliR [Aliarcobacter cibarius]|jgi:flagellar biosynthesis protein FliR|uniref:Flagellar biosynthetic protein FliR n=1 Tax=Aliarcobacter cibarius TaxID=255507 RepID=A0A5J6RJY5_9BACT|nr:flagellar biosynthetic protein FliR [Aliarcobacter cibarius]QEZ88561.1 flagellar export apparatus, transmembrane gate complex, FliR component [Aliarcobacter cibarius]QKJ26600.1 flagellar export apparatus, transmembrane gate complex, FliR component [Aliarcobacter cibarius]TLS98955.1 flagellar biosynthetic protein FliR [Aliarcobacter cibarius]TLS99871.1 flagellar biosynthetic protein FliR [Aliarcobacter cibarius]TLT03778.1 flagellar biosynthetic protein FliR [Aliarcobacter cibarius]